MIKITSLREKALRSVNITIKSGVIEKSKSYQKPWTSVKEYTLIRDESEKVYDILGYGESSKSIKEFSMLSK